MQLANKKDNREERGECNRQIDEGEGEATEEYNRRMEKKNAGEAVDTCNKPIEQ